MRLALPGVHTLPEPVVDGKQLAAVFRIKALWQCECAAPAIPRDAANPLLATRGNRRRPPPEQKTANSQHDLRQQPPPDPSPTWTRSSASSTTWKSYEPPRPSAADGSEEQMFGTE